MKGEQNETVFFSVRCSFALTSGCETRQQIMQKREGDKLVGSLEAAAIYGRSRKRLISKKANVNTTFTSDARHYFLLFSVFRFGKPPPDEPGDD